MPPPNELADELAALGPWNFLFLQSCALEAAHKAGQITDTEYAQGEIFYAHLLGAARGASEETMIELDADELGIELRQVRDILAEPPPLSRERVRPGCRQRPNRRRESRRRRNVRTRRAKARAPSGDDSEPEPNPLAGLVRLTAAVRCWAHEQRRLGARRVAA